ncbi:hypothetical protein BDR07DRAFT_508325 [Suillus spraguei]|nr:hypothetical protein BDR07DRAFT_508325 [Suillus spraguei]
MQSSKESIRLHRLRVSKTRKRRAIRRPKSVHPATQAHRRLGPSKASQKIGILDRRANHKDSCIDVRPKTQHEKLTKTSKMPPITLFIATRFRIAQERPDRMKKAFENAPISFVA